MNAKELVKNALRNRKISRPPFIPFIGTYLTAVDQVTLQEAWSEPGLLHQSLRNTQKLLNYDAVVMPADTTLEAEAFGLSVNWDEGMPHLEGTLQEEEAPPFDPQTWVNQGRLPVFIEAAGRLAQVEGRHTPILAVVSGPMTLWSQLYGKGPGGCHDAGNTNLPHADIMTQAIITLCRFYAEAGVDGIIINEAAVSEPESGWRGLSGLYKPIFNVIRHFNLPGVLRLRPFNDQAAAFGADTNVIALSPGGDPAPNPAKGGIGLALEETFWSDDAEIGSLKAFIERRGLKGVFLTTDQPLDQVNLDLEDLQDKIEKMRSEPYWSI